MKGNAGSGGGGGALSEISSLDGDNNDVDLLNPESRKFVNDREYLKFVTIQMWWNFISVFFLGMYAVLLALMGSFNRASLGYL